MGIRRGFIHGFSLVTLSFATLVVSVSYSCDPVTLATIMLYQVVMQATVCPLYWFHISEIASGATLSLSHAFAYLLQLVLTSIGPYVLKTEKADEITFGVLAAINLSSTFICYFFVKSTRGLQDD